MRSPSLLLHSCFVLLAACTFEPPSSEPGKDPVLQEPEPKPNTPPIANPGSDRDVIVSTEVPLDSSRSKDADGDRLVFEWTLVEQPEGTSAWLRQDGSYATITPHLVGTYVLSLVAFDGKVRSDPAELRLQAVPNPGAPIAHAGPDHQVPVGGVVRLDGSDSRDSTGETSSLRYRWDLLSAPAGSDASIGASTDFEASFQPDVPGLYELQLQVTDGDRLSDTDSALVEAGVPGSGGAGSLEFFAFRVVDAEYSRPLDRIVAVGAAPNRLYLIDGATAAIEFIDLPSTPLSVSVGPGGLEAAVGHDGAISLVDLELREVVQTSDVPNSVDDVVLAANGWAYGFSAEAYDAQGLELATGSVTASGHPSLYRGARARLHPDGNRIYVANNGLSPDDIERLSIADGPPVVEYNSPYHGDYSMCGDLWISVDGGRLFTACGNVFRASDVRSDDMTYNGAFVGATPRRIIHLDHSDVVDQVALLPAGPGGGKIPGNELRIHAFDDLEWRESVELPAHESRDTAWAAHARFVFFNAAGDELYVLAYVNEGAGLFFDNVLIRYKR